MSFVTFSRFTQRHATFACFSNKKMPQVSALTPGAKFLNSTERDSEERPARQPHAGGSGKGGCNGRQNVDDHADDGFP